MSSSTTKKILFAPSTMLRNAIPRLHAQFDSVVADTVSGKKFPLMPERSHKFMWNHVPKNLPISKKPSSSSSSLLSAAVLVPLVSFQNEPCLLFTTRSSRLSSHASQVSFPGGHFEDENDNTLVDTAVREAMEELDNPSFNWQYRVVSNDDNDVSNHDDLDKIQILGSATTIPSIRGTPVTPIVAILPHDVTQSCFPGNKEEVDDVFYVSIKELLEIETSQYSSRFGVNLPVYPAKQAKIWGLTAMITRPLLHQLYKPVFSSE